MIKMLLFFLTTFFMQFYAAIDWEARRVEGWEGRSLNTAVFQNRLFLAHANPSNGRIFIASSADGNFRGRATMLVAE